ncbi:MAG: hypothetical protein KIY09_08805, partial [Thermoplasmata archaeon]|nr:hypothetical protein [Candidatus Sysuiplasma acidicola]
MFVIVHVAAGVAKASSIPTNYYFTGYLGNDTIYMTTDHSFYLVTNSQGQAIGNSAYQTASNSSNDIPNAVQLNLSNKPYNATNYYYSGGANSEFEAELFVSGVGGANQYIYQASSDTYGAAGLKIGVKETIGGTDPGAVSTEIQTVHNTGLNISQTSTGEGKTLKTVDTAVNVALTAAAVVFPEIALPVATYLIMDQFVGPSGVLNQGAMASNTNGFTGSGSSWEWGGVVNGSTVVTSGNEAAGHNAYGVGTMILITISNFPSVASSVGGGTITLFTQNELFELTSNGFMSYFNGSGTSVNMYLARAVSIGGYAYLRSGVPDANSVVILQQDMGGVIVNFALKTNATGYWHFFAEPGAT